MEQNTDVKYFLDGHEYTMKYGAYTSISDYHLAWAASFIEPHLQHIYATGQTKENAQQTLFNRYEEMVS